MDKKVFETYSQYYDLLYKDKNYTQETEYLHSLILKFNPDSKYLLELGCGTGIHASMLAEKGFTIEGIDKSETMLRKALDRQSSLPYSVSEKLSFLEGDIRTYKSSLKFDVVISLFHVMSYMTTNKDLNRAIETAKNHLKHRGIFIFDCWHGPAVIHDKPTSRTKQFENESISVKRISTPDIFQDTHIVDVNFEINILNKKTNELTKLHEVHSMRYLFTEEVNSLLEIHGLEIIHAEEWITKEALSEKTWNACYVVRAKQ